MAQKGRSPERGLGWVTKQITEAHNFLQSVDLSGCKQTFLTPKVVEYGVVQDTPSFLPLQSKETVIFIIEIDKR